MFNLLPDDLLNHIFFYFNDIRTAFQHFILISKRWTRLCKSFPFLRFQGELFPDDGQINDQRFIDNIDMVLIHRDDSSILNFDLDWYWYS